MHSDNSDPIVAMRNSAGKTKRPSTGSIGSPEVDLSLSFSVDDVSDDGDEAENNRRLRTHSEISSDDGEPNSGPGSALRQGSGSVYDTPMGRSNSDNITGGNNKVSPGRTAATAAGSILTLAAAEEILTKWLGHLGALCLLRLHNELSVALVMKSAKVRNIQYLLIVAVALLCLSQL